jgi:Domain of unknown function (DUF6457)
MAEMDMEAMVDRVTGLLGPDAPSVDEDEAEAVLELARVVAHSSERRAAPVTAYLVGLAVAGAAPEARVTFLEELIVKLETQS